MLVTPLKVFANVHTPINKPQENTKRLIVVQKTSSKPYLIVTNAEDKDINKNDTNHTRFDYTDCRYSIPDQHNYVDQLEKLIRSSMIGYNSAGVFINTGDAPFNEERLELTKLALKHLNLQLSLENDRRKNELLPEIRVEYGYVGFSDEYCYNYQKNQRIENIKALELPLTSYLKPIKNMDEIYDELISIPRKYPSILTFYFTDDRQFHSQFALIDLLPPSIGSDSIAYRKSYRQFETMTNLYSDPQFFGVLDVERYSMSHLLLDYFSGSHQIMVFAHFTEYGSHTTGRNLDILHFTSKLQNIRCVVNREQSICQTKEVQVERNRVKELNDEVGKRDVLLENYRAKNLQLQLEMLPLKNKIDLSDCHHRNLLRSRDVVQAAMKRAIATHKLEMADMEHEMNLLKISLVEASVSANSFRFTNDDLEYHLAEAHRVNQQLLEAHKDYENEIEYLKEQVDELTAFQRDAEKEDLKSNLLLEKQHAKWVAAETEYVNQLEILEVKLEEMNGEFNELLLERKQWAKKNESLQLEMDSKIARMERLHDIEVQGLRQQIEQIEAEKETALAAQEEELFHLRSTLKSSVWSKPTERNSIRNRQYLEEHNQDHSSSTRDMETDKHNRQQKENIERPSSTYTDTLNNNDYIKESWTKKPSKWTQPKDEHTDAGYIVLDDNDDDDAMAIRFDDDDNNIDDIRQMETTTSRPFAPNTRAATSTGKTYDKDLEDVKDIRQHETEMDSLEEEMYNAAEADIAEDMDEYSTGLPDFTLSKSTIKPIDKKISSVNLDNDDDDFVAPPRDKARPLPKQVEPVSQGTKQRQTKKIPEEGSTPDSAISKRKARKSQKTSDIQQVNTVATSSHPRSPTSHIEMPSEAGMAPPDSTISKENGQMKESLEQDDTATTTSLLSKNHLSQPSSSKSSEKTQNAPPKKRGKTAKSSISTMIDFSLPESESTSQQPVVTKKRRKMRPNKAKRNESEMSPVINGYDVKHFEIDLDN
ncbi:uncharacterized protein BX664DRAFT_386758 [Halteromyces radiatus]|uniref:uncharacterized protein n=1 Tax=Halteromyces radiatus TaxID=101107 RepID=UPI00221EEA88|nr:uncharacterized protein BX664DRAFT_386758 [Halteromyces radiatus]KAI8086337.1 hypothetical protein BX664DRAFT_386758 [Halteromyces radiatus]